MARIAEVRISLELLQQMMTKGYRSRGIGCVEGLPEGAEFLYFALNRGRHGDLGLVFRHDSFPDVGLNESIPEVPVTFETFLCPEMEE